MAIRRPRRKPRLLPKPPVKPLVPRAKRPAPKAEPRARLQKMVTTIPEVKERLIEIRKRYRYAAPTNKSVLAEIARLEKRLREAGITRIGAPSRIRRKG